VRLENANISNNPRSGLDRLKVQRPNGRYNRAVGLLFIVRRGALRRFDRLKRAARRLPVDVIWDRRTSDSGTSADRRGTPSPGERRQQPSFTWASADFVVVDSAEEPKE
jgi:hypothetical protein